MTHKPAELALTGTKPGLTNALADTWRQSAEHLAEQVSRFVRLTVLAAIPSLWNLAAGGKFDSKTLLAFILPIAEVTFRQVFPALSAKNADSAPGVTIVPQQVGAAPDKVPPHLLPDPIEVPAPLVKVPARTPAKKTVAKKTVAKKTTPRKS